MTVDAAVWRSLPTTLETARTPQSRVEPLAPASVVDVIKFLVKVVLMAIVFYFMALYVPGIVVDTNANAVAGISITFVWLALLFAVVNAVLRPILKLLSLPFLLLTLGLFYLVINAVLLGITAALSTRLQVEGVGAAVIGGLVLAVASWVFDLVLHRD